MTIRSEWHCVVNRCCYDVEYRPGGYWRNGRTLIGRVFECATATFEGRNVQIATARRNHVAIGLAVGLLMAVVLRHRMHNAIVGWRAMLDIAQRHCAGQYGHVQPANDQYAEDSTRGRIRMKLSAAFSHSVFLCLPAAGRKGTALVFGPTRFAASATCLCRSSNRARRSSSVS